MLPTDFDRDEFIAGLRTEYARILPPDIVFSVENGWLPLIGYRLDDLEKILTKHSWIGRAVVRQIKEKFGELRIYVRPVDVDDSYPDPLAAKLEAWRQVVSGTSQDTCEICGDVGEPGDFGGHHQTLCSRHAEQRREWVAGGRKGDIFHD
jgi:hypothetical protein